MSVAEPNGRDRPRETYTDSLNTVIYDDDSPGDTTVRPHPPHLPLDWYPRPQWRQKPPELEPPKDQPKDPPRDS
jgi:hypothetical protein